MPIILSPSIPGGTTYTANDIIGDAANDLRQQLQNSGTGQQLLLMWTDRVHKEVLRSSRWRFLLSTPQKFITEAAATDYWIGLTGSGPTGSIDTGLNLSDVYRIKDDTFFDRSNNIQISRVPYQPPNFTTFEFPDGTSRQLRPTNFFHDTYSSLLRIFPAPNQQSTFAPEPGSPICTTAVSGTLGQRTYSVRYSIVDSLGNESDASSLVTFITIPASQVLVVKSPVFPIAAARGVAYNQYNVYAAQLTSQTNSVSQGNETLQNLSPIASGNNFQEPNTGLTTGGAAYPQVNHLTPLNGYVLEFQYWKTRQKLLSPGQTLQVPDDYKDILIAGVNAYGFEYLQKPTETKFWYELYQQGMREMVRDRNQFDQENVGTFMKPDAQTQAFPPALIPGFITGL